VKLYNADKMKDVIWTLANSTYKPSILHFNADGKRTVTLYIFFIFLSKTFIQKMMKEVADSFEVLHEKFSEENCDVKLYFDTDGSNN